MDNPQTFIPNNFSNGANLAMPNVQAPAMPANPADPNNPAGDPDAVIASEPTNNSKTGLLLLAFLAILSLGLIVFILIHFATTDHSKVADEPVEIVEPSDIAIEDTAVRNLIAALQGSLEDTYLIKTYNYDFPLFYSEEVNTLLPLERSYGLYAPRVTADDTTGLAKLFIDALTTRGFAPNSQITGPASIVNDYNYINPSTNMICSFNTSAPFAINCGYLGWISDDTLTLAKNLSNAYYLVGDEYPIVLRGVATDAIADSTVATYQTIDVDVGNATGLFYRVSPATEWRFFTATQSPLNCSAYNTADLANAYAGTTCYDNGRTSVVTAVGHEAY